MRKILDELFLSFVTVMGALLLFLLGKSWRIKWVGLENLALPRSRNQKVIYAFWHGRMLAFCYCHRWQKVHLLISQHRDGELISRATSLLGFRSVRGSSTRGGTKALFQMANKNLEGFDTAVTPDGPRGPKHKAQPGVIYIAQRSGMPIIPVSNSSQRKWTLKSWDGLVIPKPFSPAVVILGEPIYVDPRSTAGEWFCCQ